MQFESKRDDWWVTNDGDGDGDGDGDDDDDDEVEDDHLSLSTFYSHIEKL